MKGQKAPLVSVYREPSTKCYISKPPCESNLQDIVTNVRDASRKAGLDMNVKKTKVMVISKDPEGKKLNIKVGNDTLEQVEKMKYLGTQITTDIRTDVEIDTRLKLAKAKFSSMSRILTSKRLVMETRMRIMRCYIYSIFSYGCEAWTQSKVLEDKIDAFEMWCLRKIGQIHWKDHVTNEDVLRRLGTERRLLSDIKKRKLRYYGHIKRRNNILTTAVEGRLEGTRPRGRPRNNWFGDIREWTNRPAYDCTRNASDRHLWNVIARQPPRRR